LADSARKRQIARRLIFQTAIWIAVLALLLFGAAGTIAWPSAWAFLIEVTVLGFLISFWLLEYDPDLLEERLAPLFQQNQKIWDRILLSVLMLLWISWFIVMGLDAGRFHFSRFPLWLRTAGAIGIPLSLYLTYLTFRENSFAAPVVKLQAERRHRTVRTGPYRYVRHPMYAGALLFFFSTPLLLGSWLGLLMVPLLIAGLAYRAVMEERVLAAELDGYAAYMRDVHYRFVPLIW
jgi:protein-S-isoprenylcysteine O-methyltransferase Ste14